MVVMLLIYISTTYNHNSIGQFLMITKISQMIINNMCILVVGCFHGMSTLDGLFHVEVNLFLQAITCFQVTNDNHM